MRYTIADGTYYPRDNSNLCSHIRGVFTIGNYLLVLCWKVLWWGRRGCKNSRGTTAALWAFLPIFSCFSPPFLFISVLLSILPLCSSTRSSLCMCVESKGESWKTQKNGEEDANRGGGEEKRERGRHGGWLQWWVKGVLFFPSPPPLCSGPWYLLLWLWCLLMCSLHPLHLLLFILIHLYKCLFFHSF